MARKKIEITLELEMPEGLNYTDRTLERWLELHVASWGGIPVDDPLCGHDPSDFIESIFIEVRE